MVGQVLDTLAWAERVLLADHPEYSAARVFVHLNSTLQARFGELLLSLDTIRSPIVALILHMSHSHLSVGMLGRYGAFGRHQVAPQY